ncbi:2Fe-2S iron-sulfur cluster-binding protein [Jhaorihella thermophila]
MAQDAQYWICGPGGMNASVREALMALDVPATRIHMESFGDTAAAPADDAPGVSATARITLGAETRDVPIAPGQTILDAARAAGLTPPFACQSGVCGACRARLTEGVVHMRARMALEDADIARGDVLACQAVAKSDRIALRFANGE